MLSYLLWRFTAMFWWKAVKCWKSIGSFDLAQTVKCKRNVNIDLPPSVIETKVKRGTTVLLLEPPFVTVRSVIVVGCGSGWNVSSPVGLGSVPPAASWPGIAAPSLPKSRIHSWAPAGLTETRHKCSYASCDEATALPAPQSISFGFFFESYLHIVWKIPFSKIHFLVVVFLMNKRLFNPVF